MGLDPARIRRALELARRAPSAHNTQPWQVVIADDRLSVLADRERHLRHGDPTERDLRLGLGAFTEALRIALSLEGLHGEPDAPTGDAFATLRLRDGAEPLRSDASLLRQRQSSRLAYSPREIDPESLRALEKSAATLGLKLALFPRGGPDRAELDALFIAASRESWLDVRAVEELRRWIRFDPEGALRSDDGLSTHCLALDVPSGAALKAMLTPSLWRAAKALFVAPSLAEALARSEAEPVERAPALGLLIAPGDAGAVGGELLRFWLASTGLRLALHPLSVLLDRRSWELGRRLGVAPERIAFAFRLGRSAPPPYSRRRDVATFLRSEHC